MSAQRKLLVFVTSVFMLFFVNLPPTMALSKSVDTVVYRTALVDLDGQVVILEEPESVAYSGSTIFRGHTKVCIDTHIKGMPLGAWTLWHSRVDKEGNVYSPIFGGRLIVSTTDGHGSVGLCLIHERRSNGHILVFRWHGPASSDYEELGGQLSSKEVGCNVPGHGCVNMYTLWHPILISE